MNNTLYSINVFNDQLFNNFFCFSSSCIFFTGNRKQAIVTAIDNTIAKMITALNPVIGNNNIPINGPIAAAKLVLKP